jgi:hypothetical protein
MYFYFCLQVLVLTPKDEERLIGARGKIKVKGDYFIEVEENQDVAENLLIQHLIKRLDNIIIGNFLTLNLLVGSYLVFPLLLCTHI